MFDFKNGMLGVVVVAVAIGAALFASYFAGIESVEHDVVKYNELADVTGLFDTETSPQYVEYDPSSNYTGYYSEQSYSEEMGKYFFAEDEVYFKPYEDAQHNPRVNNYRVDLEPTFGEIKTVDISTITDEHGDPLPVTDKTYRLTYVEGQGYNNYWRGQPILLSSMIENMEYTENTTQLNYTTRNVDWDASHHGQSVNLDTILIVPSGWLTYEAGELIWGAIVNPSIDASTVTITGGAHNPVQSMTVDIYTREAKLYSDADYSVPIGTYDLDKILVFYGDSPYPYNYKLNLDVDFEFQEVITDRVYLDPNNGVSLKDGE